MAFQIRKDPTLLGKGSFRLPLAGWRAGQGRVAETRGWRESVKEEEWQKRKGEISPWCLLSYCSLLPLIACCIAYLLQVGDRVLRMAQVVFFFLVK